MRWLADECVDARIVAVLRESGHDIVYMIDAQPSARDVDVLSRACREDRVLLTEDKDFGELVIRRALPVPGIVLLRVHPDALALKLAQLQSAVEKFGDILRGRYLVIEAQRFRSRLLPKKGFYGRFGRVEIHDFPVGSAQAF